MVYGKNNLKSSEIHEYRKEYDEKLKELSASFYGDDQLIDLWNNASQKYGRVDLKNLPVFPNEARMVYYERAQVFDFVAEMLQDLKDFINTSIQSQTLDPKSGSLFPIEFVSGYENVNIKYANYIQKKINDFMSFWKHGSEKEKGILKYDDFEREFMKFVEFSEDSMLLSKSHYCSSKIGSPAMSGLFIEFQNIPHDVDARKLSIITDNNFRYLLEACRRHGFFIDKNAPWRLVVDIRSCYVRNKLKKKGIENLVQFFEKYYFHHSDYDFKDIRHIFFSLWNSYCEARPYTDFVEAKECGLSIVPHKRRKILAIDDVSKRKWVKLYITIRLKEEFKNIQDPEILDLLNDLRATLDEDNWEVRTPKYIEEIIVKRKRKKSLTKGKSLYNIIEQDCPDIIEEPEIEVDECNIGDDEVFIRPTQQLTVVSQIDNIRLIE